MRQLPVSLAVVTLGLACALGQGPSWSTYYGAAGDERCASRGMLRLPDGKIVVVGPTSSANLYVPGAIQTTYGGGSSDGFVACFDPTLSGPAQCVWATYLGGSGYDEVHGVTLAPNPSGGIHILVCGFTTSPNFPTTPGCLQPGPSGASDGFVARLSIQGGSLGLVWSTYLGGPGSSQSAVAVAVQTTGDIVVAGTSDAGFPPASSSPCLPYQPNVAGMAGTLDAVVAVLDPTGCILRARTYFGLAGNDTITSLALDGDRPVLGGITDSGIATTPGAYQPAFAGMQDGFVARFDASLCVLEFATHLGGGAFDFVQAIDCAPGGQYAVAGWTQAGIPMLRTTNGRPYGGGPFDAFVVLLDPTQTGVQQCPWASFYGGAGSEGIWDLVVDACGLITVVGETDSTDLYTRPLPVVTAGAWQTTYGGGPSDAWVARLDPQRRTSREILYATYLGRSERDRGFGLTLDAQGDPILASSTMSPNWPVTPGACQPSFGGGTVFSPPIPLSGFGDVFVTELPLLPARVTRYGQASPPPPCGLSVPVGVNSMPAAGNATFAFYACAQPNAPLLLVLGVPQDPPWRVLNVDLFVNPFVNPFVTLLRVADPTGFAAHPLPLPTWLPPGPLGIGAQWLFLGPPACGPLGASEPLR